MRTFAPIAVLLWTMTAGCTGVLDDGSAGAVPRVTVPARIPLRALTPTELDLALDDLLGDDTSAVLRLQPSAVSTGIETLSTIELAWAGGRADRLVDALYDVALRATENHPPLADCVARDGDAVCVRDVLEDLATRAWRRAPSEDELARLIGVPAEVPSELGRREGIARAVQAVLLSPELLYLTSIGGAEGSGSEATLTSIELASRMSFFLWATLPDAALLDAAERDLTTPDAIEAEARRMLASPLIGRGMARFVAGWLGALDLPDETRVDPAWNGALVRDMRMETEAFVLDWVTGENRSLEALFYADHTFVTPQLAELYGTNLPAGSPTDVVTRIDGTHALGRHGLLTQASFLAAHATEAAASSTRRGHWFIERALCQHIDPPPPTAGALAPPFTAALTTRQWHEGILVTPGCSSCHRRLEPPGFAFEGFDAVGRLRDVDRGQPVVTSMTLTSESELDGSYEGADDLSEAVSTSFTVRRCFARQMLHYAMGRPTAPADYPLLRDVARALETDVHEAMVRIVVSPTFRAARAPSSNEAP